MRILLALVPVLLLVGCGSKPADLATGNAENRERSTQSNSKKSDADLSNEDIYMNPPADLVAATGIDAYPGAKVMKFVKAVKSTVRDTTLYDTIYFVNDAPEKVIAFYQDKLPEAVREDMPAGTGIFILKGKNRDGWPTTVRAAGQQGRTNIHVVVEKKE